MTAVPLKEQPLVLMDIKWTWAVPFALMLVFGKLISTPVKSVFQIQLIPKENMTPPNAENQSLEVHTILIKTAVLQLELLNVQMTTTCGCFRKFAM